MKRDGIIMTLDAGGTNMVFSAVCEGEEAVQAVTLPSAKDNLEECLRTIRRGFEAVRDLLPSAPAAISFAFPGPADYEAGVIGGNLPNLTAFRGGVPLGAYLEGLFGVPVFINNDGNLFAYGEALAGMLPWVNAMLERGGNPKRYHNLVGITLGTGFGGGIVVGGKLLTGDNQTGGYVWCQPNFHHPGLIAEESVSIRGVCHAYARLSADGRPLTPKDIFAVAEGEKEGDATAARAAFACLGEVAGEVLASALMLIDGLAVVGGGLSGASKYIFPAMMSRLRATAAMRDGTRFPRLAARAFNLDDSAELAAFLRSEDSFLKSGKTGVALSRLGTSRAVMMGAYLFAAGRLGMSGGLILQDQMS